MKHNHDYVSLNEIIKELFVSKGITQKDDNITDVYKNFESDQTTKIKDILKGLGYNLDSFAVKNGKRKEYQIPVLISDFLYVLLSLDSPKGSYISKIKTGKVDKITFDQQLEFIDTLGERFMRNEKGIEDANIRLAIGHWKIDAYFVKEIIEMKKAIQADIYRSIDKSLKKYGMPRFIDIIGINTSPQEQDDLLEEENPSFDELDSFADLKQLTNVERSFVIRKMHQYLKDGLDKWENVLENYRKEIENLDIESIQHIVDNEDTTLFCDILDELGTAYDVEQVQQLKCLDNAKTDQYLRVEPVITKLQER